MRRMISARIRSNWLLIGCVALMLLVGVAAVQQYRWINRVSEADRRQRREYVEATLRNFGDDFRERIHEPLPYFRPSPAVPDDTAFEPYLSRLALQWRATAEHPQLLGSVSFATTNASGVIFKRLRIGDKQFTEESWPEALTLYRTILENRLRMPGGEPPLFPNGFALALSDNRPVIVFPLVLSNEPPPPPRPEDSNTSTETSQPATGGVPDGVAPSARMPPLGPEPDSLLQQLRTAPPKGVIHVPELKGWCFLELDLNYLENQLLPELVARHFGQETLNDYRVAVVTGRPTKIIYRSDSQLNADVLLSSDAEIVIFNPHLQPGRPTPPPPPPPGDENLGQPRPERPPPPPAGPPPPFISAVEGAPGNGAARPENAQAWLLILKNRSGSLDALVAQQRRRNLALSFGILLLLAGSTLMLMLATRRARGLARQQMEFVAGVSHELRTPLTVIQSTSYNLSKGMIQEPGRVEKYGLVIQKEARRLINQIERMLSFAGIQSGQKLYELRPVEVKEIINRALDEYATAFEEGGWHVDKQIDEDLPQVLADAQSLESAIENLLENGLKYASEGKWLSISATSVMNKKHREVQITVADHGPGIAPADLPHIFKPFYRGQGVLASSSINGSGLGLCLVERHLRAQGGRVTVKSSDGEGTAFTLHLAAHEDADDVKGRRIERPG